VNGKSELAPLDPDLLLSVVIPSWNTRELLAICLEKLFAADTPSMEVIVVDNGSEDGSAEMTATRFPDVVLLRNEKNEGFARGCNQGMRIAQGRLVLLLNTDTEVAEDAIRLQVNFLLEHEEYGAVAPRLIHPSGQTQPTVMAFPGWKTPLFHGSLFQRWFPESRELRRYFERDWDQESDRDVDQPPAAVLLLRRRTLEEIGLFDEGFWLFYNDVDLSLRMMRAGWKTRYLADAVVVHHIGASTSKFARFLPEYYANRLLYFRKHFGHPAGWWVKLCSVLEILDFVASQLWERLHRRPYLHVGEVIKDWFVFLGR
jgi:N-acetylglucosaminyl-diphospho-decaprenol L-rhamnosyltransferase